MKRQILGRSGDKALFSETETDGCTQEMDFPVSTANLESVSGGGGTIHPLLSLPGPEGGNSARGDLSRAEELHS